MPAEQRGVLGILAGGGELPRRLAESARAQGRSVFLVAFKGHTDPATPEGFDHIWSRLGAAGEILDALRRHEVQEIVLAGPVKRPSLGEVWPDRRAARFFSKIGRNAFSDDGLLGSIVHTLEEEEGFHVIGIDDVMTELIAEAGVYGRHAPDELAHADIARGVEVVQALGRLDVGQAAVIQQGIVLGVEAVEGTDALLERAGALRRDGPGGVLVKIKKPGQEHRVDLPTVGIRTVKGAAAAGLRGVALQAGASLLVDRQAVVDAADEDGLFIFGLTLE
jgi:DUF1009 family protein